MFIALFISYLNKVEIRADIMVPYHATKAWGQVPCEDVALRIPLPECWIYQFRTEKHNLSLSQVKNAFLPLYLIISSLSLYLHFLLSL